MLHLWHLMTPAPAFEAQATTLHGAVVTDQQELM
jgi:hypothetical protein